ncbi:unnamed protein product [Parnassius apollo]|uniref:(apollo) hypothetical protein n=1 Tax=Parnassius apollo TaxID=110799 RepID=A0A8S3WGP2_PARAO|nr:unnamed protein product [Parnassius apollo]
MVDIRDKKSRRLVVVCERGGRMGLVFPLERGGLARRGARSADWARDAACLRACLSHLHTLAGNEAIPPTPSESLETALFCRWERLNKESKGSLTSHSYSKRQLRYLCRVARELLNYKKLLVYEDQSTFRANLIQAITEQLEPIEDLIHILAIALDQARDAYINNFQAKTVGEFDRELTVYRSKKWNKLKDYYDASSACLIDAVRRDPELRREDLKDEANLMKNVLLWLHKGAKEDKKYLGPVLRPYLDGLFNVSMENSWFLEDFDASRCEMEYEGLGEYCMGVHNGEIEPCMGLLDAAKKFTWAKAMVDFLERYRHIEFRLVFPTGEGLAVSYAAKLPSRREHSSARILTLSRRDKAEAKIRLATRCVLGAFNSALVGDRRHIGRHESSEEILKSVKSGNFWRNNTKPDIIPVNSHQDASSLDNIPRVVRRSRRNRPPTSYGFPEITIIDQSDTKTLRRKYHTLRNLVYTEPVENIKELKRRPRSAGSTVKNKEAMSRPSILETLDFINSVKDALYVEESGTSDAEDVAWSWCDEWVLGHCAPLSTLAARGGGALHLALADLVPALLQRARFTILQELCSFLGESSEGALFALHRLARAARSRSSERATNSWKLPEASVIEKEAPQRYKSRPLDYVSGDEAPQPPPLPRNASKSKQIGITDNEEPDTENLDLNAENHTTNENENLHREKIIAIDEMFAKALEYFANTNPTERQFIPKQRSSKKLSKIVDYVNNILLPQYINSEIEFKTFQNLVYCAAWTSAKLNGAKIEIAIQVDNPLGPEKQKKYNKPKWEQRLENKVSELRAKIARLTQYINGNRGQKINQTRKFYT